MPLCNGCGASYDNREDFCPYCRRHNPTIPNNKEEPLSFLACPYCKETDKVEKVAAIIAAQTRTIQGVNQDSAVFVAKNGRVIRNSSNFSGTESTSLAKSLIWNPPPVQQPKEPKTTLSKAPGITMMVAAFVLFFLSFTNNDSAGCCASTSILFFLFGVVKFLEARNYNYEKATQKYSAQLKRIEEIKQAKSNYNQLYYCYRDARVFIPESDRSAPIEKLNDYLFSQVDQTTETIV